MTAWVVVGVDPGGRMTGIAARCGDVYLGHELVVRRGRGVIPDPNYLREVCERVQAWTLAWPAARVVVAIEGVHDPNPARAAERDDRGGGLIALGKVVGALELYFPDALVVPPDHHGRNLLAAYPRPLVDDDELARLSGDGPLQHCRSAWDVAGRAVWTLRQAARAARRAASPPPDGHVGAAPRRGEVR